MTRRAKPRRPWQFAVRSRRNLIRHIDALAQKSCCSRNAYITVLLLEAVKRKRVHKPRQLLGSSTIRCDFKRVKT